MFFVKFSKNIEIVLHMHITNTCWTFAIDYSN